VELVQVEYETIIQESSDAAVFLIGGNEVLISKDSMDRYDYEGRIWMRVEVAVKMGLNYLVVFG